MLIITFTSILLSFFVAYFGRNRRMGFWGYFFASLLLTPIIGMLLVIISEKRSVHADQDSNAV